MSSINGLGGTSPLQQTQNLTSKTVSSTSETSAAARPSITDRLELSGVSYLFQSLKANGVRTEKVADIKAHIADGTYDTDGSKLDGSLDKVLDDLLK